MKKKKIIIIILILILLISAIYVAYRILKKSSKNMPLEEGSYILITHDHMGSQPKISPVHIVVVFKIDYLGEVTHKDYGFSNSHGEEKFGKLRLDQIKKIISIVERKKTKDDGFSDVYYATIDDNNYYFKERIFNKIVKMIKKY